MKIMDKLSTYAALLGVIGAIGGGFYTWGQFNSRLDALEAEPPVNLSPLKEKDKELTRQFDDVLLYANEYKVDLIDRINKVEEKIKPVDLTKVFNEIGKVREEMALGKVDFSPIYQEIGKVREEMAMLNIPDDIDLRPLENALAEVSKQVAIALKENELQNIQLEEIKLQSSNPLSN